jgi:hypothetical protein
VDKIRRNQAGLAVFGLILTFAGVYLFSIPLGYPIPSLVTSSGIALMISGIRYKERINTKTLTGEERAAYLKSSYFILTMTGAVVLFGGLGVIALLKYLQVEFFTLLWCLIIVLVSIFLMLAARIIKATQKNEASLS